MSGDGVSLPTTLAQMGSVAKTQARAQQSGQPVAPFHDQRDKKDELRVQRVRETEKPNQGKVDPDADRRDKRQRRRDNRQQKVLDQAAGDGEDGGPNTGQDQERQPETLGVTIDLRA
ncbi:MAG: hypothetical protein AB7V45_14395 [Candidatus Krumholzibacteriia bacterium]